uniref:Coiled-coil domain containing 57 n=1 Tax=Leptobrachium leishanense TaxID=445787 RepID=A0A8C5PPT0_9ANUR
MLPDEAEFTELLAKKEQEWKGLQQRQVVFLESAIKEAKQRLQEEKEKFDCLKRDFTHNLRVLGERDRELEQYEVMYSRLKVIENAKQGEISDLKVQVEKIRQGLQREKKNYGELQGHYQRKLKEHQIEMERVHSAKTIELDRHREEYEKVKHQLERKIEEVQGDLSLQKQEMMLDFESEMKKREHEFRLQLDELSTLVLSHELKVWSVSLTVTLIWLWKQRAVEVSLLYMLLRRKMNWILIVFYKTLITLPTFNVVSDPCMTLVAIAQSLFPYITRHEQLDRCVREKECALRAMKEVHAQQLLCMLFIYFFIYHSRMKGEIETLKTGWDKHITQVSKDTVGKDLQIQSLHEENEKLKAQINKYQKDIERYQHQLALAVERERLLEQAKVQTELDWQKRCEEVKKVQYQHSEDLIESLTSAKEQIFTTGTKQEFQFDFASSEIQKLQEQNSELRLVIGQMRKEMESLCEQIPPRVQTETTNMELQGNAVTPGKDSPQSLEDEIQNLKQKCRQMEEQLQAALSKKDKDEDPLPAKPVPPDNVYIQNYIAGLNETIGNHKRINVFLSKVPFTMFLYIYYLLSHLWTPLLYNETVKHLREEVLALRQQLNWCKTAGGSPPDGEMYLLCNKLKAAVKKISQLSLEKQQLIDMGNRLRAERAATESPDFSRFQVCPGWRVCTVRCLTQGHLQERLLAGIEPMTPQALSTQSSNVTSTPPSRYLNPVSLRTEMYFSVALL